MLIIRNLNLIGVQSWTYLVQCGQAVADRMDLPSEDVLIDLVDTLCQNVSSLEGMGIQLTFTPTSQLNHFDEKEVENDGTYYARKGHVHHNKPDTPICSDFILGKCKKGFKCPGHHCLLPFHWQYKLPDDEWKSFNETDNEKLEKLYCDVTLEEWSATGYHISLESDGFLLLDVVDLLFQNKRLLSKQRDLDVVADIRRLSSESFASNPEDHVATAWSWYWQNESGIWLKYDVDHLGRDMQISIEEAFLSKSKCISFRISDQDYRLFFSSTTEMYQENVRYGTRKEVRRRPAEFQSRAHIQLKRSQSANQKADNNATRANVPTHWSAVPSVKQYTRVPLTSTSSEYKETETLFKKTVNKNVVIKGIERVQNPFMWEKYQRKKENMLAVKTGGQKRSFLNEKRLFHGTFPETVEAICKQNFDWRLHGKNATVYGEGSYFALNASYSDAFAKEDANSCRFMFVAKVLVGSYAMGHSSYRRPPQKDSSDPASDLYDSCVDDKSNPTIFVVFDTDQFYPEYIVKYSHESAQYPSAVAYQTTHGSYQQPVAKKPVPKPRVPKAAPLQSGASQVCANSTAAIPRSSSTPGTSVYSSTHGVSVGHSTGLNAAGVSPYSKTSGSNSGSTSGYNTSSASNAASTRHQTAATRPQSGASNSYNSSSASSTTVTGVSSYSKTSGSNSGLSAGSYTSSPSSTSSTRYQNTTSRSHPSTQSGSKSSRKYKSSSKDKSKCSVM